MNIYRVLEDIKDGAATTSKYDNKIIRFKTPNVVMVFSNKQPDLNSLSKDRWEVYTLHQTAWKVARILVESNYYIFIVY